MDATRTNEKTQGTNEHAKGLKEHTKRTNCQNLGERSKERNKEQTIEQLGLLLEIKGFF